LSSSYYYQIGQIYSIIEWFFSDVLISPKEKALIQANLLKVINNEIPLPSSHKIDSSIHSIDEAIEKWKVELTKCSANSEPFNSAEGSLEKSVAVRDV
jgi:hypothetical protein